MILTGEIEPLNGDEMNSERHLSYKTRQIITFSKKPTNIRGHRYKWMVQDMTEHQRKRAFGVISCLLYLCNAIKPDNTVKDDIKDLFCSMPDVPVFMIGFTRGWDNNPLWE